jgi:hypothetical protein
LRLILVCVANKEESMRRLIVIGVAAAALAGAGIAVAQGIGVMSVKSVAATFTATTVSTSSSRTCTNGDGTFVLTRALYSGTAASSDPSLNGAIALAVTSLINTTKNLGTLVGSLRIDTAASRDTTARFHAAYAGGRAHGLAWGRVHESSERLLANVSADFSAAGGFQNGKVGATDANGAAIEWAPGRCEPAQAQPEKRQRATATGTISALSASSITVAGLTCVVPAKLASKFSGLQVGDLVRIRCQSTGGDLLTLVKIKWRKHD